MTPVSVAPVKLSWSRFTSESSVFERFAAVRTAPTRLALLSVVLEKSAADEVALSNCVPDKSRPEKFAFEKSKPETFARTIEFAFKIWTCGPSGFSHST